MFAESMRTKNSSKLRSLLSSGLNRSCRAKQQKMVPIRCQSKSAVVSSLAFVIFAFIFPLHRVVLSVPRISKHISIYFHHRILSSWVDLPSSLGGPLEMSPPCHLFICFQLLSTHVLFGLPKPNKLTHTHHSFMPPVHL